ncbi:MAG: GNAT family N-acetyltransferase [Chthonomonadales bacterium]|nr:GNAT family N-acetyltransferase [Chthonomonadales bacterium]
MIGVCTGSTERQSIAHAVETNLAEWYRTTSDLVPSADFIEESDVTQARLPARHPLFTAVLQARFDEQNADQRIDEIVESLRRLGMPAMWWICSESRPPDLSHRVEERGFIPVDILSGMALDLEKEPCRVPIGSGFTVEEVRSAEGLREWSVLYHEGFGMDAHTLRDLSPIADAVTSGDAGQLRFFLGRRRGEPVSCAMLFLGDRTAGVYWVATAQDRRNRGYGSGVVLAAVAAAREAGYKLCVLHASPMGVSVYRKLGFVEYCHLRTLTWRPEAEGRA